MCKPSDLTHTLQEFAGTLHGLKPADLTTLDQANLRSARRTHLSAGRGGSEPSRPSPMLTTSPRPTTARQAATPSFVEYD
jgi:hypothetical protein